MATFNVQGKFKAGVKWEKFTITVDTINENTARETILSTIGSKHKLNRSLININSITKEA
jgi:large subunit ribosomal protein LX